MRLAAEFYTKVHPELAGKAFGECVEHFKMAVAIGVVENGKRVVLNPPNDYVIQKDTGIVVVAEDDDAYECEAAPVRIDVGSLPVKRPESTSNDRLLFVGWTDNIKGMLEILNTIFDPGTEIHLLNRTPEADRLRRLKEQG